MTQLRVGYLNVRGLTQGKWRSLLQLVDSTIYPSSSFLSSSSSPTSTLPLFPTFDLLFLAETWFVDQDTHLRHPAVVAASPLSPSQANSRGHAHGGLLAIASPAFKERIQRVACTPHSISVLVVPCPGGSSATGDPASGWTHLTAVYFPPSLTDAIVRDTLRNLPSNTSLVLGDINVRYGVSFGDTDTSLRDRRRIIDSALLLSRHMVHLRPTQGTATVDHAFVQSRHIAAPLLTFSTPPPLQPFAHPPALPQYDHPLMALSWSVPHAEPWTGAPPPRPAPRYFLKHLADPAVSRQLCELYDLLAALPTAFALRMSQDWPTLRPVDRNACIDDLDQQLLLLINTLCKEVLGSYAPDKIQRQVVDHMEPSLAALDRPISDSEAIRLFKRAQRSRRPQLALQSREPLLRTAAQDAVLYLASIYQTPPAHAIPEQQSTRAVENDNMNMNMSDPRLIALRDLFTPASVQFAIRGRRQGKSPGPDAMDVAVLKALLPSDAFLPNLVSLFRLCALAGYTPRRWNESLIHPIPKDPASAPTIDERRPISLTVMFRRIFESVLLQPLTTAPWAHLHPSQAGFRSGFSTLTHALVAHEASRLGTLDAHVFVDLRQAYDRVPIQLLLHKLSLRLQDPAHPLVSLIGSLFLQCSSRVAVNGTLSDLFLRHRGLFQGSLLSPWLFDIFIDDLASALNEGPLVGYPTPTALLFADDILIQTAGLGNAQSALDTLSTWIHINGMEPNIAKCGLVLDSDVTDAMLPPSLELCGQPVPLVDSYRYLGFPFTKNIGIDWKAHAGASIVRATRCISSLIATEASRSWTAHTRLALYKAFARPLFEYGAPVVCQWLLANYRGRRRRRRRDYSRPGRLSPAETAMIERTGPGLWKDLEAGQDKALQWIFGYKSPAPVLRSLSALGSMQHRFHELACRFTYHLEGMDADNPVRFLLGWSAFSHFVLPRPEPRSHSAALPCALLHSCTQHPLREVFSALPISAAAVGTEVPWAIRLRSFLLAHRLDELNWASQLPNYIAGSCRSPTSGVDALLALPNNDTYKQGLAWRRNVVGMTMTCPTCSLAFKRSHIHNCLLLEDGPAIPDALTAAYAQDERTVVFSPAHFTILDFLLNEKRYALFDACSAHIKNKLLPRQLYTVRDDM